MVQPDDVEDTITPGARARARLTKAYADLAVIAVLCTGAQMQFLSVPSYEAGPLRPLELATSIMVFGGLVCSTCTTFLAILSSRWFSGLREDEADYLASRWLAQTFKHLERKEHRGRKHDETEEGSPKKVDWFKNGQGKPNLAKYLDFQINSLQTKLNQLRAQHLEQLNNIQSGRLNCDTVANIQDDPSSMHPSGVRDRNPTAEPASGIDPDEFISPGIFDTEQVLMLLKYERCGLVQEASSDSPEAADLRGKARHHGMLLSFQERFLGWALMSPFIVAYIGFYLFCSGILALAWDQQPRIVAMVTSVFMVVFYILMASFSLPHRRKEVIRKLYLGRSLI